MRNQYAGRMVERTGRCRCGAVAYRFPQSATGVLQCHCENCRRISGNFVAAVRAQTADLAVAPDDGLRWYDLEYAAYGFCFGCGSTLFYRAADRPHITSVMAGTLDDASGLALEAVWFADEAQSHNTLPSGVALHDGNG